METTRTTVANRILSYFKESRDELKKVVWPSRKQTVNDTMLVIAISLFVAIFLGAVDMALNYGLQRLLTK